MKEKNDEDDSMGAVESDVQRIVAIKGNEALGYKGEAREEHSGENAQCEDPDPAGDLADNREDDM